MNDKPAGLLSRIRLGRLRCHRNWDMLFVALPRNTVGGGADCSDYKEGQPVCDVQQRIVDQAKAQGNTWDTGVVPGHPLRWSRIPRADEVKVECCLAVPRERRVDDGETH